MESKLKAAVLASPTGSVGDDPRFAELFIKSVYCGNTAELAAYIDSLRAPRTPENAELIERAASAVEAYGNSELAAKLRAVPVASVQGEAISNEQILAFADGAHLTCSGRNGGRESPFVEGHDITVPVINFARALLATSTPAVPHPSQELVKEAADDYKQIAHKIGVIYMAGDFKAETAAERELEALLIKTGHRYANWAEVDAINEKAAISTPAVQPLAAIAEQQHWIPIDERMPEPYREVHAKHVDGSVRIARRSQKGGGCWQLACFGSGETSLWPDKDVTHWCILAASEASVSPWISVKDRLPEVETPVLIILDGDVRVGELQWEKPGYEETFKAYRYWDDPHDDGQGWDDHQITHWMPLPVAPQGAEIPAKVGENNQEGVE